MAAITRCFLRNLSSSSSPPLVPVQLPSRMETHFWYIVPDEVKSGSLLNQYMELLSPSERENVVSMGGDQLRKRALLARTLVRTTIARSCGVTANSPIGIDVEEKQRKIKHNVLTFARRYFTPREVDHLSSISDPECQLQELVKLRTLKESEIIVEPPENHEAFQNNWQFALLEVEGSHYASICTEKIQPVKLA